MGDLAHASENDTDLFGDRNAQHWAERFASKFPQVFQDGEGVVTDVENLMLAWFAGAIESGFDLGRAYERSEQDAAEAGPCSLTEERLSAHTKGDRMNAATWAWLGLAALITAYVLTIDLWLQHTGRLTMSAQFHLWMLSQVLGPVVVALWMGVSAGLVYHFLINK